jgi:hypothetical protein
MSATKLSHFYFQRTIYIIQPLIYYRFGTDELCSAYVIPITSRLTITSVLFSTCEIQENSPVNRKFGSTNKIY